MDPSKFFFDNFLTICVFEVKRVHTKFVTTSGQHNIMRLEFLNIPSTDLLCWTLLDFISSRSRRDSTG